MEIEIILKNARTYVPMKEKREFIQKTAERCFDRLTVTATFDNGTTGLPPMYKENTELKARYAMGALLKLYLRVDAKTEAEDENLLTEEEYDRWAERHILNEIERAKADASLRNICFDLLQDYKALEKMLNSEVYGLMQVMNDPVVRIISQIEASTTPKNMENAVKSLEEARNELANLMAQRKEKNDA